MSEKLIFADDLLEAGRNTSEFRQHLADEYDLECLVAGMPAVDAVEVDKVAQMFYEFTGDDCQWNYNDNDEWLPEVCELQDECPRPADKLGCWKQFVKHFGERRKENAVD